MQTSPAPDIVETTLLPAVPPLLGRRTLAGSHWCLGALVTPLITGADTHGRFAVLDMSLRRGTEPPAHTHQREDETYFVLEGQLRFCLDEQVLVAGPGDTVHLPRGRRHCYQLETEYARVLLHLAPAGLEHCFQALAEPAAALIVPPRPLDPDVTKLLAVAARFGVTFD
ncbi:cupin domain-containing protein [Hymenobacter jeollabukensis]|nr:cupin domain-containing protein [Hymenobacter jeollabukensis]